MMVSSGGEILIVIYLLVNEILSKGVEDEGVAFLVFSAKAASLVVYAA
jgi:hypothetical protein